MRSGVADALRITIEDVETSLKTNTGFSKTSLGSVLVFGTLRIADPVSITTGASYSTLFAGLSGFTAGKDLVLVQWDTTPAAVGVIPIMARVDGATGSLQVRFLNTSAGTNTLGTPVLNYIQIIT